MILEWINQHGSPVDAAIVLMGMCVVFAMGYFLRSQKRQNERLWAEIKEAIRLYNQVDKLEALNSLAIRFLSDPKAPIETMKQSADGKGDHALNRDV